MAGREQIQEPQWSARDEALWTTAELALLHREGRLGQRHPVSVPFAMQHAGDERPYAHGPFRLLSFEARGDGSYQSSSSLFVATGRGAIPAMLGYGAAAALVNSSRRRRAAALAAPQWTVIDTGTLTVTNHGFYLHTPSAILAWGWTSIQMATLVGPGKLQLMGTSTNGGVNWILESDWAELVFFFWATARCAQHEQLLSRLWLPDEWVARASAHTLGRVGPRNYYAFLELSRGLGMGAV
ncbi:hypothetical protein E8P82_00630 [Arthrobacter echini]|uniref:Uncharacterized protein n=1 Tax=Arthrobacter echini TaxID=1529066 RepID=A0A4S5E9R3_9MICC|nr:hypothetical protein [Arthrobacter echini]THJ68456.1 hypothetical protein E8P82_00630 [Arthrobacter echini]